MKYAGRETVAVAIHKGTTCITRIAEQKIKYFYFEKCVKFYLQKLYSLMVYISIISKLSLSNVMLDEIKLPVEEFLAE